MQRNITWLLLLGMAASVVLTASDADAAWRRRAWRRSYNNGGSCCSASYSCCDAGANQHGQPYQADMQQGGPLEAPPAAPQEPQNTPPAPSAQ